MFENFLDLKDFIKTKPIDLRSVEDILYLLSYLKRERNEHLLLITINKSMQIKNIHTLLVSSLSLNIIDPKHILYVLLQDQASAFILVHNHPSGESKPSVYDKYLTQYIKKLSALLNIELVDHIIITSKTYFSFKEANLT